MAIYVSKPALPPLEEFIPYLEQIWDNKLLTNNGPFHQQLETAMAEYLGVKHLSLFTNGTIALITAIKVLQLSGEVITTPYSFVASSHAILWNGLRPVFVDIDPVTLNLDPAKIEAAITSETSAILPVHCYGTPCDVDRIQRIADKHNLKVLYDAAHAFAGRLRGRSLLVHGDLSVLSLHATKVFHTFEGGAIISPNAETKKNIDNMKNFGFLNEVSVVAAGINGKMNEIQAAFGLLQLKNVDHSIQRRKKVDASYRAGLENIKGVSCLPRMADNEPNYAYFPILIGHDYPLSRDELYEKLKKNEIYARRYFYPLISDFPMYNSLKSATKSNLRVAHSRASEVICLPIYPDLATDDLERIIQLIKPCDSI
jgi:dTDP-4-amino-4,6-dideoxygalactose transaminase